MLQVRLICGSPMNIILPRLSLHSMSYIAYFLLMGGAQMHSVHGTTTDATTHNI